MGTSFSLEVLVGGVSTAISQESANQRDFGEFFYNLHWCVKNLTTPLVQHLRVYGNDPRSGLIRKSKPSKAQGVVNTPY